MQARNQIYIWLGSLKGINFSGKKVDLFSSYWKIFSQVPGERKNPACRQG